MLTLSFARGPTERHSSSDSASAVCEHPRGFLSIKSFNLSLLAHHGVLQGMH